MAEIAVITVNYGTAELAITAVESVIARTHGGHHVEVHLVDNASPGDDAQTIARTLALRKLEDRVTFHPQAENLGFGRGNNVVLEMLAKRDVPPKYVFLLNPDARLENEAIAILADFLDTHPEAGMVGAAMRKPGADDLVSTAFRFPGLASAFQHAANFGPITRLLKRHVVALPVEERMQKVDWVMGAAVMARFEAWQDQGFFDPSYFLYFEETDLMLQAARAGWECWYVPQARVIHSEGAATGVKSGALSLLRRRKPAYWYRSWRHYYVKNYGRPYALAVAALWMAGAAVNIATSGLRRHQTAVADSLYSDLWAIGIRPLLGLPEGRVKQAV